MKILIKTRVIKSNNLIKMEIKGNKMLKMLGLMKKFFKIKCHHKIKLKFRQSNQNNNKKYKKYKKIKIK